MTSRYMKDAQRGMAAVDQRICYRREALVGDVLTVRSAVLEIKPRSIRFVHEMVRDQRGDLLAVMMVTGVHIDVSARKSVEFEPHILEQSRARIAPDVTLWERWPPERAYLPGD
jgi:acyl-CoA thioester hydrolase